jgi:hypothetical protein
MLLSFNKHPFSTLLSPFRVGTWYFSDLEWFVRNNEFPKKKKKGRKNVEQKQIFLFHKKQFQKFKQHGVLHVQFLIK